MSARGGPSGGDEAWLWLSRVLSMVAWLAGLNYVVWRWRTVLQTSYWLSLPFIVSEGLVILLGSGLFYFQLWRSIRRRPYRLTAMGVSPRRWPPVDVFIPTYLEPMQVVERTLRGALSIEYPVDKLTIYLLDDGGSEEGRELVDRLNRELAPQRPPKLVYVARLRKAGVPHHAKAGNLNHALFEYPTSGEYILLLDCDMVPRPHILHALLPHAFTSDRYLSERIGMVQSPQAFFNAPPHDPLNHQSLLFYQVLMPGWDAWGCSPCCGTNVLFRRQALLTVGGFSYGSITEDFLTSCNLAANGFVTKYVPEVLAVGLAPEDLDGFFVQRLRWAVGGLQIGRYFNPLVKKGLSLPQRLLYTWAAAHYLLSLPSLLLACTPFIFLLDDGKLLLSTGSAVQYLCHFLPFYVSHLCVNAIAHRQLPFRYFLRSMEEGVYLLFNHVKAVAIALSGVQLGFHVTRKDGVKSPFLTDVAHVLPHLGCLVLGTAAMASGILDLLTRDLDANHRLAYTVNLLWACLVLVQLWPPIGVLWALHATSPLTQTEAKPILPRHHQVDGFGSPILQEVKILPQEPSTTAPQPSPVSHLPIGGGAAREEGVGERTPILQGATIVPPKVGKKGGRGRGR